MSFPIDGYVIDRGPAHVDLIVWQAGGQFGGAIKLVEGVVQIVLRMRRQRHDGAGLLAILADQQPGQPLDGFGRGNFVGGSVNWRTNSGPVSTLENSKVSIGLWSSLDRGATRCANFSTRWIVERRPLPTDEDLRLVLEVRLKPTIVLGFLEGIRQPVLDVVTVGLRGPIRAVEPTPERAAAPRPGSIGCSVRKKSASRWMPAVEGCRRDCRGIGIVPKTYRAEWHSPMQDSRRWLTISSASLTNPPQAE